MSLISTTVLCLQRLASMFRRLVVALVLSTLGFLPISAAHAQPEMLVVRGDGNWPPYEMTIEGELTGFHIELVKAVAQEAGIRVKFVSYPWARALKMARKGQVDAITYIAINHERQAYIDFHSENILSGTQHFIVENKYRSDITYNGKLEQLLPHSIVHISQYSYGEPFDSNTDLIKTAVKSPLQIALLIAKNRYDLGILTKSELEMLRPAPFINDLELLEPPLHSTNVYLGISKASTNQQLMANFTDSMRAFKQTERYQILRNTFGL
ncbi:putative Polar amino acid uptake family ABC transporter, periplasmic substrate-binding protein [Vibrio tapetis subsp. tapetis]|uniref:Putative Polar amino acid uptake family ABC transporter, periplasmic substrate-binding protein n=2 Tax=Vibrio tapetis TaxID=52443 RepID=A0A2N8ZJP7_9VIBR|nr:putative Polar amino acid uptake family ABC transporter, periplasmic substrate-binding protein [Vibrio tapetis subsp. tapetis]